MRSSRAKKLQRESARVARRDGISLQTLYSEDENGTIQSIGLRRRYQMSKRRVRKWWKHEPWGRVVDCLCVSVLLQGMRPKAYQ